MGEKKGIRNCGPCLPDEGDDSLSFALAFACKSKSQANQRCRAMPGVAHAKFIKQERPPWQCKTPCCSFPNPFFPSN